MPTIMKATSGEALRTRGAVQEWLTDPAEMRRLLDVLRRYAEEYEDAVDFYRHVPVEPLRVLLDFDVIWSYTELDRAGRDPLDDLRWFFLGSSLPYAVPRGAFEELLKRLAGLVQSSWRPIDDGEPPADAIAELLGIDRAAFEEPEFEQVLDDRLSRHARGIHRLTKIFANQRCEKAVCSHYNEEMRRIAHEAIVQQRREKARPRTDRDERDAINLAVTLTSNANRQAGIGPYWILVSSTKAVIRASRALLPRNDEYWLAVTPQLLRLPDQLGAEPSRRRSGRSDAATLAGKLRELSQIFGKQLDEAEDRPRGRSGVAVQVEKTLRSVATTLNRLKDGAGRLERIELERASLLALDVSQTRGPLRRKDLSAYGVKYFNYLKLLDALVSTLAEFEVPVYTWREVAVKLPIGFSEYQIQLTRDPRSPLDIITLRVYGSGSGNCFWTGQWPISEDAGQLVTCLKELDEKGLLSVRPSGSIEPEPAMESPVDGSSPLWHEGVIISGARWSDGRPTEWSCGVPFSWLDRRHRWEALVPERLRDALQGQDRPGAAAPAGNTDRDAGLQGEPDETESLALNEIRINTPHCDIVFDLLSPDEFGRRRLTVLSHRRLASLVACLYDWLGPRFILRGPLRDSVDEILRKHLGEDEAAEVGS
jgi:hypothetical protein